MAPPKTILDTPRQESLQPAGTNFSSILPTSRQTSGTSVPAPRLHRSQTKSGIPRLSHVSPAPHLPILRPPPLRGRQSRRRHPGVSSEIDRWPQPLLIFHHSPHRTRNI